MGKKRKVAVLPALKPKPKPKKQAMDKPVAIMPQEGKKDKEENGENILISRFHTLQKQLGLAQELADAKQVTKLRKEMQVLGGLPAYQSASLRGEAKGGFNASSWVLEFLAANHSHVKLPAVTELLDVGAIVEHYKGNDPRSEGIPSRLQVTSIDINPLSPGVLKADFFEFASSLLEGPQSRSFDIIVLSLVVNFVGDPWKRGLMLSLASRLLTPGGLLFLVLPSACVLNSRFMNQPLLTRITTAVGLSALDIPTAVRVTASLWMGVYSRVGAPLDPLPATLRKRNEIRVGPGNFNNFAILLGDRQSLPNPSAEEPSQKKISTSNQRKKARKQKQKDAQKQNRDSAEVT